MLKRAVWQHKPDSRQIISGASHSWLRVILLTTVTIFAGLMSVLVTTSRQAQCLIQAAASLGYAIMFATIITLIVILSLLMIHNDVASLFSRNKRPTREEPAT